MTQDTAAAHLRCPQCDSKRVAELVYDEQAKRADGQLLPELQAAIDAGEIVLAHCEMECDSPEYQCSDCGYEW